MKQSSFSVDSATILSGLLAVITASFKRLISDLKCQAQYRWLHETKRPRHHLIHGTDMLSNRIDRLHAEGLKRYLVKRLENLGHSVILQPLRV